jgi:hypothetical protein
MKDKKYFPLISLFVIFLIIFTNIRSSAQTISAASSQCSIAPIEIIENKSVEDKKTKQNQSKSNESDAVRKTTEQKIPLSISNITNIDGSNPLEMVSFGDRIRVEITNLDKAINQGYSSIFNLESQTNNLSRFDSRNLVLHLNNYPLKNIHGEYRQNNLIEFQISRLEDSRSEWNAILESTSKTREVKISVGCPNGQEIPSLKDFKAQIHLWHLNRIFVVIFPFIILLFSLFLCWKSPLLRTSGITEKRAYSLAKTQLAWWFYIVFISFLSLFIVTGNYSNILTQQSIILLGIGSLTTLGSSIVDDNITDENFKIDNQYKINELEKERIELTRGKPLGWKLSLTQNKNKLDKYELQSKNIFQDIVTDSKGQVNLHRYQMVIWTTLLGCIFIYEVFTKFQMPEFDAILLTLQGISSGTYITLKSQKEIEKPEKDAKLKAEEDAKLKTEEDARLKTEEDAKLKTEEDARLKTEEDAKLKTEEDARLKTEEDARLKLKRMSLKVLKS